MYSAKKHTCQKIHFKKRAKERFDASVNNDFYRHIIKAIIQSEPIKFEDKRIVAVYKEKQSSRVALYNVYINGGEPMVVVYDKNRNTLVTALY